MAGDADVAPVATDPMATDQRPPAILFWSAPESAAPRCIAVPASIETLVAMLVTAYFALKTGHLLTSAPSALSLAKAITWPYNTPFYGAEHLAFR